MHHIGEQHRYLLVLSRLGGVFESRTALVAELGVRRQFCAARPTEQPRRGQSTATIPAGVHVSIVSLLVNDVRHIAVPPFDMKLRNPRISSDPKNQSELQ
jgi:hypothetical protein